MAKNFFAGRWGIICVGAVIGILAGALQRMGNPGNPGNMGICVACFERDIAGALGLHRAGVVQYLRPEIIGFVLGALIAAVSFKEFKPRSGSAPIVRFVLGFFAMIGALVYIPCYRTCDWVYRPKKSVLHHGGFSGSDFVSPYPSVNRTDFSCGLCICYKFHPGTIQSGI